MTMQRLLALSGRIDRATAWLGRTVAWLILLAVLVSAGNAVIRKTFNISSNAWLELQWYLFGAVFMLVAAWTLQRDEHVRIDVVSSRLSQRMRAWIDLICHILFLMPFVIMMVFLATPYVWRSLAMGERSMNAGGLILWPAKLLILLGFVVLAAQGFSEIVKRLGAVTGHVPLPPDRRDEAPPFVREEARLADPAPARD